MKTLVLLAALALFCSVLFAEVQEYSFDMATSGSLVKVSSAMDFKNLLPKTNYSDTLAIAWNVPDSALQGIQLNSVAVYVQVSNQGNSQVLFSEGGRLYPSTSFILNCTVADGTCSKDSLLSRSFDVLVETPSSGSTTATLKVDASLTPFSSDTLPVQVEAKIAELDSQATKLNEQGASVIDAQSAISAAKAYAARDEYNAAAEYLRSAENILSTKKPSPVPDPLTVLSDAQYRVNAGENASDSTGSNLVASSSLSGGTGGLASALSYFVPVVLVALVALACAGVYIMRKKNRGSRRKSGLRDQDFVVGDEN